MYKRYHEMISFEARLLGERGGPLQKEILERALLSHGEFVEWFEEQLIVARKGAPIAEGDEEIPIPERKFDPSGLSDPSGKELEEVYSGWTGISRDDACSVGLWSYATIKMVRDEKIMPRCLFANAGSRGADAGLREIQEALGWCEKIQEIDEVLKTLKKTSHGRDIDKAKSDRANAEKRIDRVCRNFIRHTSGVQQRGWARSLYSDCYLASMYWKCKISEESGVWNWKQTILPVLNSSVWKTFIDKTVTQLTVLGDINLRNGLLMFLASDEAGKYKTQNAFENLLISISAMTAGRALGCANPEEVKNEIEYIESPA